MSRRRVVIGSLLLVAAVWVGACSGEEDAPGPDSVGPSTESPALLQSSSMTVGRANDGQDGTTSGEPGADGDDVLVPGQSGRNGGDGTDGGDGGNGMPGDSPGSGDGAGSPGGGSGGDGG